jgi:hypothetical protein
MSTQALYNDDSFELPSSSDRGAAFQDPISFPLSRPFIATSTGYFQGNDYLSFVMLSGNSSGPFLCSRNQKGIFFAEIHDRRIRPGDLELKTKSETIELGVFGIAKVLQPPFHVCQTEIGTLYYFSPKHTQGEVTIPKQPFGRLSALFANWVLSVTPLMTGIEIDDK